ncbi:MAG: flavin reductase family protein [Rhodocyclaceae bacterium]|nr:flavin reductase family protein [Rhodocyclaceae bacterium]
MPRKSFPLAKVYGLLETGPVVLLTTAHKGKFDIMAQSWHTMLEFEPPQIASVVSNRNASFDSLKATRECVIAIPTVELSAAVVGCGNTSGRQVDKFAAFGLTAAAGACVAAPLIEECYANLECRVIDTRMVNRYGLFVLEVVKAWIDPARQDPRTLHHRGRGAFMVAGETIKLASRMK